MTDSRSDSGAKGNLVSTQQPRETRRDEIVKLRKAGQTYEKIGRRFGITKERVRQILKGNPVPRKPVISAMLTTRDVASFLNVHINTVRRWSNQGRLRAYRVSRRGDRRFWREDVDALLKEK